MVHLVPHSTIMTVSAKVLTLLITALLGPAGLSVAVGGEDINDHVIIDPEVMMRTVWLVSLITGIMSLEDSLPMRNRAEKWCVAVHSNAIVYVWPFGKWNCRGLTELSPEKIEQFWRHYEQCARRAERDSALRNDDGTVFIVDWDGFSLRNYATGAALQSTMKMLTFFVRFINVIKYAFYINVNYAAETFINLAKPYFTDMLDKTETYGTRSEKWKPYILRRIPASQLPTAYGGNKDWKPLPFK